MSEAKVQTEAAAFKAVRAIIANNIGGMAEGNSSAPSGYSILAKPNSIVENYHFLNYSWLDYI